MSYANTTGFQRRPPSRGQPQPIKHGDSMTNPGTHSGRGFLRPMVRWWEGLLWRPVWRWG